MNENRDCLEPGILGSYSEKQYSDWECPKRVTVRILPEKREIYPRFRDYVTKELGSDVCFVTTSLWEIFLRGMDQLPPSKEPLEIKFLRQNVQINIGCQIFYQPKKARRTPGNPAALPSVDVSKNHFFPLLLEEWQTLSEPSKTFWRQRLQEAGIIPKPRKRNSRAHAPPKKQEMGSGPEPMPGRESPPSIATGKRARGIQSRARRLMEQSMTNVTGWNVGIVGALERREREEYLAGRGEF